MSYILAHIITNIETLTFSFWVYFIASLLCLLINVNTDIFIVIEFDLIFWFNLIILGLKRRSTLFSYDASDPNIGFSAALDSHQVTMKKVTNVFEETATLQNFGAFRQAVRFAYNNEVNDVSDPMQNDQYFIVSKLDSILPEKVHFLLHRLRSYILL